MEACQPPFSARAVTSMSLTTDAGEATVTLMCDVFGISCSAYYAAKKAAEHDVEGAPPAQPVRSRKGDHASSEALQRDIKAIVAEHPAWGVRKVWATLRRAPYELKAAHRRVYAVMKAMGACLVQGERPEPLPRLGTVTVEQPNRRWATDFTTVWTKEDGVVAVVPVIDCGCRSMLAIGVTKAQDAAAILAPVRVAIVAAFDTPAGVPDGFEIRTDHGPQYTGATCDEFSTDWNVDHTFAPVGRPTGNAVAERVIRTMKEECIWLRDWVSLKELEAALAVWQLEYNERRPHQSLHWSTPSERRQERLGSTMRLAA